jgi:UDP-N-acetylglucosamine diphosphorylase / glucose-1-phosphate thymidylyltransferase / UDP-N-acetylgalactosamine diphosphorylase / glucosamine-1-phosphate N-acetyltransferase / galactosamine-1-phosphate N-acetyltransferase
MARLVLFEDEGFVDLLPLVLWRSVFELRAGRKLLIDRISQQFGAPVAGVWTRDWIAPVAAQRCGAPANEPVTPGTVLVNGRWMPPSPFTFPSSPCAATLDGQVAFVVCDKSIAADLSPRDLLDPSHRKHALARIPHQPTKGRFLRYPWEIVSKLSELLEQDWTPAEASFESRVDGQTLVFEKGRIHIGENTSIHPTACLDARGGPIHLSHDVRIGAYAVIEGPAYIGPGCTVNPHAWLHGGNAVGAVCKIGGEIDACVIDGYTNKQHSGFLGHAYVGSWVNIGAGAANSDLKNTYGKVRVPINGTEVDSGLQFFGAVIADHVKIGINASIPTGAVIGVASNIATSRMVPKYVPSFSWLSDDRMGAGDPARLLDAACAAMTRRNVDMTDEEIELFLELGAIAQRFERRA